MKITQKMIDYYNNNRSVFDMSSFNEDYNKAHGIPSMKELAFIHTVHAHNFGICRGKVTMKMIKEKQKYSTSGIC